MKSWYISTEKTMTYTDISVPMLKKESEYIADIAIITYMNGEKRSKDAINDVVVCVCVDVNEGELHPDEWYFDLHRICSLKD